MKFKYWLWTVGIWHQLLQWKTSSFKWHNEIPESLKENCSVLLQEATSNYMLIFVCKELGGKLIWPRSSDGHWCTVPQHLLHLTAS
jgi:hypothetical protein